MESSAAPDRVSSQFALWLPIAVYALGFYGLTGLGGVLFTTPYGLDVLRQSLNFPRELVFRSLGKGDYLSLLVLPLIVPVAAVPAFLFARRFLPAFLQAPLVGDVPRSWLFAML